MPSFYLRFEEDIMSATQTAKITPDLVHTIIGRNMLADGFNMVVDLEQSRGAYIHDSLKNRKYVDFFTYFASAPLGMNHPKMHEPEFLAKLQRAALHKVSNSDLYTVEMAEFVDTFARLLLPDYMHYLFFVDGGALAVENALKVAFDWKVRKNFQKGHVQERGHQVIHFREAFHGRSGYTMSLTNTDPTKTDLYPKFHWPRILNPKLTFPVTPEVEERVIRDEELALAQIRQAIHDNPDDIAALIIEPIQGEGGDNHFRPEFLRQLRTITLEEDIMFILDEIQTGVGITGKMWAHQYTDVRPDIFCFGKKTQICGIAVSTRVDEAPGNVFHTASRINSTWGGNLADMVRSTRYMEIIQEDNLVENARIQGDYLLERINGFTRKYPELLSNPRGRGLFAAFTVNDRKSRNELLRRCREDKAVIALPCGPLSIRFRPPLDIDRPALEEGLGRMEEAIAEFIG
jgi:L-lysine 6-transaminase